MIRDKDETMRKMIEEKRKREQYEMLRREVEAKPSQVVRIAKRPAVQKIEPRPVQRRKLDESSLNAFQAVDQLDKFVLIKYATRTQPNPSLPKVPFAKKNGYYWVGQRRCHLELEGTEIVVILGPNKSIPFITWIEQVERVEALKMKGFASAQPMIYGQSLISV